MICTHIHYYNERWLDVLLPHADSYKCTSGNVWIDIEAIDKQYRDSNLNNHVLVIKILGICKIPIFLIQFVSHYRLVMRFYLDSSLESMGDSLARSISVGLPVGDKDQADQEH